MTEFEQRIEIAKLCGQKFENGAHDRKHSICDAAGRNLHVPSYTRDLNAIHWATMAQTAEFRKAMRFWLYELTDQMSAHDATAPQRAEAFLRTADKWKENANAT